MNRASAIPTVVQRACWLLRWPVYVVLGWVLQPKQPARLPTYLVG